VGQISELSLPVVHFCYNVCAEFPMENGVETDRVKKGKDFRQQKRPSLGDDN